MASKKQKKTKGKTISLQEFAASLESTTATGQNVVYASKQVPKSWADEDVDDEFADAVIANKMKILLPSAPRASRGPDFNDADIPTVPPFTAHMGNISFDIDEGDVYVFFKDLEVTDLRLPRDVNNRLRGFGYVQFKTRDDLIEALCRNEQMLNGRPVRISLGNQNEGGDRRGGGGGRNQPDQTPDDWRSAPQTQLDAPPPRSDFARRSDRDNYGSDYGSRAGGGRGYGGGRYDSNDGSFDGGFRGGDYGGGRRGGDYGDRDRGRNFGGYRERRRDGPSGGEDEEEGSSTWRQNPVPRPGPEAYQSQEGRERPYGRRNYDGERDGQGPDRRYGSRSREISPDFSDIRQPRQAQNQSSEFTRPSGQLPPKRNEEVAPREERKPSPPRERRKLVIAPRTVTESSSDTALSSSAIFGGARPVDTAAREREIEKKLAEQVEQQRVRILQRPILKPEQFIDTNHTRPPLDERTSPLRPPPKTIPETKNPSDSVHKPEAAPPPPPSNAWTERRERQEVHSQRRELEDESYHRSGGRTRRSEDVYEDEDGGSSRDHQQSPHPDSDHKDTNSEPEDERDLRLQREEREESDDFQRVERRRKSKPPSEQGPPPQAQRGGRGFIRGGGGGPRLRGNLKD